MYTYIKHIFKFFIPKRFLQKHELFFRKLLTLRYLGKTHQCNICQTKLSQFIKPNEHELICPACGSLSRTRRLYQLLYNSDVLKGNLLHFSPSRSLYRKFKNFGTINYFSSDYADEFLADYHYDITDIDQKSSFFDTIICYHILEHVEQDEKAMKELFRVLKKKGKCFIQTPFKDGDIYENLQIQDKEERLKHFGQSDHVRIYSVEGLKKRLETCGFSVDITTFKDGEDDFYLGLQSSETVLVASKN